MKAKSIFAVLALGSAIAVAQAPEPTFKVTLASTKVKAGSWVKGTAILTFAPDYHGYQNPPTQSFEIPVKIEAGSKDVALKVVYPKGELKEFMETQTAVYEGEVKIPFTFKAASKPGQMKLAIKVSYQQCDATNCFPPSSKTVILNLTVTK